MVGSALRIVYFGTPAFAVPTLRGLLASRHTVVALVSQPDRARGRGQHVTPTPTKAVALEAGVPVLQPLKLREQAFLSEHRRLRGRPWRRRGLRPDPSRRAAGVFRALE